MSVAEGQYCTDCDEGRELGGREALAKCLEVNNNNFARCQKELKAFEAAARAARAAKKSAGAQRARSAAAPQSGRP